MSLKSGLEGSGDLNLLVASMLGRHALISCWLLPVRGEEGSIIMGYPSSSELNHIMCLVMSKDTVLLDVTDQHLPYNVVPANCLANDGLVIADKDYGWISLRPTYKHKISAQSKATLTVEGVVEGSLSITHEGYGARDVRAALWSMGKDDYIKNLATAHHLGFFREVRSKMNRWTHPFRKPMK